MNTGSSSIKVLTVLFFIVITLGLFLYFGFGLLKSDSESQKPLDDVASSPVQIPVVVPATVDGESVEGNGVLLQDQYEHEELPLLDEEGRARVGIKGERSYYIRGRAVMADGTTPPAEVTVTCLTRKPPHSLGSSPDFGERFKRSKPRTETPLPSVKLDGDGTFMLKGLPNLSLYLQVMHPFLRPAKSKAMNPNPLDEEEAPGVTLVLEKAGVVEGRVSKPDGSPAGSASIFLRETFNPFAILTERKGYVAAEMTDSDEEGNFRFEQVPAGRSLVLDATLEGFAPIRNESVSVKVGREVHVELKFDPACSISGMVVDAQGATAHDISVMLLSGKGSIMDPLSFEPRRTKTLDDEGTFAFEDLPSGSYIVKLNEPGYVRESIKGIKLAAGKKREGLKLVLNKGLEISGIVVSMDETPIPEARIKMEKELSIFAIGEMISEKMSPMDYRSDESGVFIVSGLTEGDYDMEISADDHFTYKQMGIPAGTSDLRIVLDKGGIISGIVISSVSGEPVKDYNIKMDQTSGGVESMLDPMGMQNKTRRTIHDDKGKFSLSGLLPGEYELSFKAKGFGDFTLESVAVAPGEDARGIIVALPDESIIAGIVFDAVTGDPISGASISRQSGIMGMIEDLVEESSVTTDEYGRFEIGGLSAGKVRLVANHQKYEEVSMEDISILEGEKVEGIEIGLSRGSTIRGHVWNEDHEPVVGATIFVTTVTASTFKSSSTDEDGYYEVSGLSKGNYAVQKMPEQFGFNTQEGEDWLGTLYKDLKVKTFRLKKDEVVDCDFVLGEGDASGTRVTGRVMENNQPKTGIIVQFTGTGPDDSLSGPFNATTNKEGIYRFDNIQPGKYRLFISNISQSTLGSFSTIDYDVTVPERDEFTFDVDLPSASLSGRVRDKHTMMPLGGVRVILLFNDAKKYDDFMSEVMGNRVAEIYTGSEGEFQVSNLREGRYNLRAGGTNLMGMDSGGYAFTTLEDISLRDGERKAGIVLSLEKGGTIEGHVTDTKGAAVAGASIHVLGPGQPSYEAFSEVKTDATGFYRYSGLAPGEWSVKVKHTEFSPREDHSIWIDSEKTTTHSVKLAR